VTDGEGRVVAEGSKYNAAGQYGEIGFGNGVRSRFMYDNLLRMTSIRTVTASGGALQSLDYAYDPGGNILSITDQAFGASQELEYDSIGRLILALGPYGQELYEYDAIGNLLRKGSLVFTVDPMHPQRVIFGEDTEFGRGKSKGRSFHLSYDALGNVVEKGDERFEYDSENHLVRVLDAKGKLLVENVYDAAGHRVIQRTQEGTTIFIDGIYEDGKTHASRHVRAGPLLLATIVTPRATVRLIRDVREASIDLSMAGRWCWVFTALVGVFVSALALIPVPGRGGPMRRWLAGLAVVGAVLRRHPGKVLVLLLIPVFVLVTSEPLLCGTVSNQKATKPNTPSEKRYYYHSNHLGSVNVVTDEQGKVVERRDYKPYGDPFDWTGPRSGPRELLLTFDGQRYDDSTGFYYFGARHYDAQLGRFLTADTQVPDPMNPKTLHRYAFAGGNPIRYSDPTGHAWYDWLLGIFIVIALVVIGAILTVVTFGAAGPPLLVGLTLGLAFLGAGVFAAVALAHGFMPTSSNFWLAVAGGFALGAAIGAGLAALPTAIAGGFWASIAASALVGAVMGGIETAIVHFVNGGGIEGLFGALFNVDALISAGIGAAFGAATGFGFGWAGIAAKTAATAIKTTITVASAAATLLSTWSWFYAGFMGRSFTEAFWMPIPILGLFMNSPPKSLGIPAWGFAGTWPGSGRDSGAAETAALLQTMPLAL